MTCRSGCSAVINNATNSSNSGGPGVNGIDRRILNYDKYLKVVGDVSDLSLEESCYSERTLDSRCILLIRSL